jgi:hypothetical protein
MPALRTILESLGRALTSPSWEYSIWYFPVFARRTPRRPDSGAVEGDRFRA